MAHSIGPPDDEAAARASRRAVRARVVDLGCGIGIPGTQVGQSLILATVS